jgi:hypothetical protein
VGLLERVCDVVDGDESASGFSNFAMCCSVYICAGCTISALSHLLLVERLQLWFVVLGIYDARNGSELASYSLRSRLFRWN